MALPEAAVKALFTSCLRDSSTYSYTSKEHFWAPETGSLAAEKIIPNSWFSNSQSGFSFIR